MKAIEGDFPFEYLSEVAEIESWRKELYRPIYYMHKWWARRLGSVFRAVILGAFCDEKANIMDLLYKPVDLNGLVVFDPFMGSGTTIGEAHKLGCTVIGRDINPVAYRLSNVFAKHAYPKKHPQIHIVCPDCNHIFPGTHNVDFVECPDCDLTFDPRKGNANRTTVFCRHCGESFSIVKAAFAQGHPPDHRLYAKLILSNSGKKKYLRITEGDLQSYKVAQKRFEALNSPVPHIKINPGYNTQQVLNYGYQYWDQMFNERQLLALSILAGGIRDLPFEVAVNKTATGKNGKKVFGISAPIGTEIISAYPVDGLRKGSVYLSCGNSAKTDIPAKSVDVIITDPPFFDNVHYAELADFFYVWQQLYFFDQSLAKQTTRHPDEVQDADVNALLH